MTNGVGRSSKGCWGGGGKLGVLLAGFAVVVIIVGFIVAVIMGLADLGSGEVRRACEQSHLWEYMLVSITATWVIIPLGRAEKNPHRGSRTITDLADASCNAGIRATYAIGMIVWGLYEAWVVDCAGEVRRLRLLARVFVFSIVAFVVLQLYLLAARPRPLPSETMARGNRPVGSDVLRGGPRIAEDAKSIDLAPAQVIGVLVADSHEDLTEVVLEKAGEHVAVVAFISSGCMRSRRVPAMLSRVHMSGEYPGAVFCAVDVDKNRPSAAIHEVSTTPTLVLFVGGREVHRFEGGNEDRLRHAIHVFGQSEQGAGLDVL